MPLLLIARRFLVDGIRSVALSDGRTPFGTATMMRFPLTTWLTAGRFMRGTFGVAKAAGFVFLAGLHGWTTLDTTGTWLGALDGVDALHVLGWGCVWLAVALTVVRGIPVVVDAVPLLREHDDTLARGH